jgi:hypothetical protein
VVTTFDRDLRVCLEVILGSRPPAPELDGLLFFKQWLAERNLGLVPIASAAVFQWPGYWLARVRAGDSDRAVVMFGAPSGPFFDPDGIVAGGGAIEEGWLVAPLDLYLSTEQPYGAFTQAGSVAGLLLAPDAESPLIRVEQATALADRGLEGDRYSTGRGTFSGPGRGYQLTLIEAEALEPVDLSWEQARRNVVTRGVELNPLVGERFLVGPVECIGRRLAEPCAHLEQLTRPGILRPLVHRGGLRADILVGGTIRVGDELTRIDPPPPVQPE